MSGECCRCGEHTLDCMCNYDKCTKCNAVIYMIDKTCMKCLIQESKELLKKSYELLERLERDSN